MKNKNIKDELKQLNKMYPSSLYGDLRGDKMPKQKPRKPKPKPRKPKPRTWSY